MKLDEMGVMGREVKISDDSPEHAGEVGKIVNVTMSRAYIEFKNGDKTWISNKHIVGTRKTAAETAEAVEYKEFEQYPLNEMAAKKTCAKCGNTMAKFHYWRQSHQKDGKTVPAGWQCKKASTVEKNMAKKEAPAEKEASGPSKTAEEMGLAKKGAHQTKVTLTDAGAKRGIEHLHKKKAAEKDDE